MGFQPVNQLTHHLESLFDQLRSRKRMLDRPVLDLTFRCLDELRDYHRDLRAQGQSTVDLSGVDSAGLSACDSSSAANRPDRPNCTIRRLAAVAAPATETEPANLAVPAGRCAVDRADDPQVPFDVASGSRVDGVSAQSSTGRHEGPVGAQPIVHQGAHPRDRPSGERLDEIESLTQFTIHLTSDVRPDELRAWPMSKESPRSGSSRHTASGRGADREQTGRVRIRRQRPMESLKPQGRVPSPSK